MCLSVGDREYQPATSSATEMTITLSQHNDWKLFQETEEQAISSADEFDITWKYPEQLDRGYSREIRLRKG